MQWERGREGRRTDSLAETLEEMSVDVSSLEAAAGPSSEKLHELSLAEVHELLDFETTPGVGTEGFTTGLSYEEERCGEG